MENINSKYRNIVERAILAGIITEDNKHIYLSSVQEENGSDLSEIESLLSIEKGTNLHSYYKSENEGANKIALINPNKNTGKTNQTKKDTFDNDDIKSVLSGSTIENYSILDIKSSKYMNDIIDDSTSDSSSIKQQSAILESTHSAKPTGTLPKVVRKPMKDQIIDFNVPIYINLKKKESTIKPHALNSPHMTQQIIANSKKDKDKKLKLKTSDKVQNERRWTFSKTKMSDTKKQDNFARNVKTFADASTSTACADQSHVEHGESESHTKDKSVDRKGFSFLTEKTLKQQSENPIVISKASQTELDKTTEQYDSQTYTINARRKLKIRDNMGNTRQKHKRNENSSMRPEFHEQLGHKKNEISKHIYMSRQIDRCKLCKCHCSCKSDYKKVLDDTKTTESSNEDIDSLHGISREINNNPKDIERFLNVNIICQFYDGGDDDDSVIKNGSIQDSQTTSGASEIRKTFEEPISENEKSKKNNKMQCLFRVFASMVNKRKLRQ